MIDLERTRLSIDDVVAVARGGAQVALPDAVRERIGRARAVLLAHVERATAVYGITTGVGVRKRIAVERDVNVDHQRRLIAGHVTAQGPDAPRDAVRAALCKLAFTFARGETGVRAELVDHIVRRLNEDRLPRMRILGSGGMSDLAAMADLATGLCQDFELAEGEALPLLNSNASNTGWAALAVHDLGRLGVALEQTAALSLEGFAANLAPLDATATAARGLPGQRAVASRLRALLDGSALERDAPRALQDPTAFRNASAVLGAFQDAYGYVAAQVEHELSAHQGSPFVDVARGSMYTATGYEVQAMATALDLARIALAPVLTMANERLVKHLNRPFTGLPEGLTESIGSVDCGLSELGWVGMSLTAEARSLAHPVSFDAPTTTQAEGIEDRMTSAPLAVRRLVEMTDLGFRIVALELVAAAQAVDLRGGPTRLGVGTRATYEAVRRNVAFMPGGAPPPDVEPLALALRNGASV